MDTSNSMYGKHHSEETKRKIGEASRKRFANGMSPETRKKMSDSKMGIPKGEEFCRKLSERTMGKKYTLGYIHTEATKNRISNAHKGKPLSNDTKEKLRLAWKRGHHNRCGENHPAWKGGITPINMSIRNNALTKEWRRLVFERDQWTCQDCGNRGGTYFNAHHIKSFSDNPDLRLLVENGVTLCRKCHIARHTLTGARYEDHQVKPLRPRAYTGTSGWMAA